MCTTMRFYETEQNTRIIKCSVSMFMLASLNAECEWKASSSKKKTLNQCCRVVRYRWSTTCVLAQEQPAVRSLSNICSCSHLFVMVVFSARCIGWSAMSLCWIRSVFTVARSDVWSYASTATAAASCLRSARVLFGSLAGCDGDCEPASTRVCPADTGDTFFTPLFASLEHFSPFSDGRRYPCATSNSPQTFRKTHIGCRHCGRGSGGIVCVCYDFAGS